MNNETLIRRLIKGSIQRAIQESVAAVFVLVVFAAFLAMAEVGSLRYYGCLITLVATGFIAGIVWLYALSYQSLTSHSPSDLTFWREAFYAQAKLLRWVPLWYCAPICSGCLLFVAPTAPSELWPFLLVSLIFLTTFAGITWLNRQAANKIDEAAKQLIAS